jgi:hypothetical protein
MPGAEAPIARLVHQASQRVPAGELSQNINARKRGPNICKTGSPRIPKSPCGGITKQVNAKKECQMQKPQYINAKYRSPNVCEPKDVRESLRGNPQTSERRIRMPDAVAPTYKCQIQRPQYTRDWTPKDPKELLRGNLQKSEWQIRVPDTEGPIYTCQIQKPPCMRDWTPQDPKETLRGNRQTSECKIIMPNAEAPMYKCQTQRRQYMRRLDPQGSQIIRSRESPNKRLLRLFNKH